MTHHKFSHKAQEVYIYPDVVMMELTFLKFKNICSVNIKPSEFYFSLQIWLKGNSMQTKLGFL